MLYPSLNIKYYPLNVEKLCWKGKFPKFIHSNLGIAEPRPAATVCIPEQWFVTFLPCDNSWKHRSLSHLGHSLCVQRIMFVSSSQATPPSFWHIKWEWCHFRDKLLSTLNLCILKANQKKLSPSWFQYFVLFIINCLCMPHFSSVSCSSTVEAGRSLVFGNNV